LESWVLEQIALRGTMHVAVRIFLSEIWARPHFNFGCEDRHSIAMSTAALLGHFAEPETMQPTPEFRVVIVYETYAIGAAAMGLCQRLVEKFDGSYLFRFAIESFDELEQEPRFEQSLKAAEGADMIVVGSAGALPAKFLAWFGQCVEHRREDGPVALVDMTSDTGPHAREVHELLRRTAQAHRLDLICKEQFARPIMTAAASSAQRWHRGDVRHWGINE
jgi:hypothetical protein